MPETMKRDFEPRPPGVPALSGARSLSAMAAGPQLPKAPQNGSISCPPCRSGVPMSHKSGYEVGP